MTDPVHPAVLEPVYDKLFGARQRMSSLPVLCQEVASNGPAWLPLVLVLGAIGAVAYADHRVVVPSLIYLYILPLTVGAILLRKEISYVMNSLRTWSWPRKSSACFFPRTCHSRAAISRHDAASEGVGGDYYDYISVDAHTMQIVIAEVAGKGVLAPF
jgi:hypothetical protein